MRRRRLAVADKEQRRHRGQKWKHRRSRTRPAGGPSLPNLTARSTGTSSDDGKGSLCLCWQHQSQPDDAGGASAAPWRQLPGRKCWPESGAGRPSSQSPLCRVHEGTRGRFEWPCQPLDRGPKSRPVPMDRLRRPRRGRQGSFRPGSVPGERHGRKRASRRHSGPLRPWAGRLSGLPGSSGPGYAAHRATHQRNQHCKYVWPLDLPKRRPSECPLWVIRDACQTRLERARGARSGRAWEDGAWRLALNARSRFSAFSA
jgi:hypothetical protein